ncbi:MAG: thrombospondin type 3 repeat-containing protein [Planctomycetes bacterium]|nr:thrombospondin type 3 repeat-containing protein [Planctomycetota bacterium]
MYATTDFNAAIHDSLDGRVHAASDEDGGELFGSVVPWNEYALIVSLALRQADNTRALKIAGLWLDPAALLTISYRDIPTLTDNPAAFAPAFWVHQQHFFSIDFAGHPDFELFLDNHRQADALYCAADLGLTYRYGLTAGVIPSGYRADRIYDHSNVYSPEAVAGWGDVDTLLEFEENQPVDSDSRFRYGLTRVSSLDPNWIPNDTALVDHLFLMFGLVESLEPQFFVQRFPFQEDGDHDGIADTYDNCPEAWNRRQEDGNGDGIGDACDCATPFADADGDGDVDLLDFGRWQLCSSTSGDVPEACLCFDRNGDHRVDALDLPDFTDCLESSGPGTPADPDCGG